jgi:hypothetical protein
MHRCEAIFRLRARHSLFSMKTLMRDNSKHVFPLPEHAIYLALPQDYIIRLTDDAPTPLLSMEGSSKFALILHPSHV